MSAIAVLKRPRRTHIFTRHADDWYVEPPAVTAALLDVETFVGVTWDPACGQGNIPGTFLARGLCAFGTDKVDRGADAVRHGWRGTLDFLAGDMRPIDGIDNVVSNPPYYGARGTEGYIRRALRFATGKVAMFAPIGFLASARRARGLYAELRPHRVWILADRPSCPAGDCYDARMTVGGGTVDFAWYVWDATALPARETRLGWIVAGDAQGRLL